MKSRAKVILIKPGMTVKKVMQIINNGPRKAENSPGHIAIAINKNNKLIGVVTDGDIRRAFLKGAKLTDKIDPIINTNPIIFNKDLTPEEILDKTIQEIKKRVKRGLDIIFTVDEHKQPYDIFTFFELWRKTEIKTRVVSIVGLGYVGLTLGLVLADAGFRVVGVDQKKDIIADLRKGKSHIHETGIQSFLKKHLNKDFTVQHKFASNASDVYIVCVGTPVDKNKKIQTEPLVKALSYITHILKKDDLIILRSTVSVGTCRQLVIPYLEKQTKMKVGEDFYLAFAPERTIEGDALSELHSLPQVIGGYNKKSSELTVKLFNHLTNSIILTDSLEEAEMVKLLNNSYRDLTFSFANEVALMCSKLGLKSHKIIKAANSGYSRSSIPQPSPGVGGYCLTKDPYILINSAKKAGYAAKLPQASRQINDRMISHTCLLVDDFVEQNNKPKDKIKIFVIGLAFKGQPETADMRHSTSLEILKKLSKKYKNIYTFDPVVKRDDILKNGFKYFSLKQGFRNADCILILNNHKSYINMDIYNLLLTAQKPALLFDSWNIFDDSSIDSIDGIKYQGL